MKTFGVDAQAQIDAAKKRIAALLRIQYGTSSYLHYTDADGSITFDGAVYSPRGFGFDSAQGDDSLSYHEQRVLIDNVDSVISGIALAHDLRGLELKLFWIFIDAAGDPIGGVDDYVDMIEGYIESVELAPDIATVSARGFLAALEKTVPSRNFGANCPWTFGGTECGADNGKLTAQTVDAGSTTTVVADAARSEAANYWINGIFKLTSGALSGRRGRILSSATGTITLEHALDAAPAAGVTYEIERGCDRTWTTCLAAFANTSEFGGFIDLPAEIVRE